MDKSCLQTNYSELLMSSRVISVFAHIGGEIVA